MDVLTLLGVMLLAYGSLILLYYRMRSNERKTKISNFMLKGTMNMRRGNLEKALVYFSSAYEYSLDKNIKDDTADALYYIGYIHKEKGEIETAREYWEYANNLYREINDDNGNEKIEIALKSIME